MRLHPDAWSWYQGALGEIEVGKRLATLGPEWFVRHSVPIGADTKDVDHLVIGPGGVFAINAKHHARASVWVGDYVLRVNGGNTRHLKAGRDDAADVARRLSAKVGFPVAVTPVIAVLNAASITDRRPPHNRPVQVVDAGQLVAWLLAQPPRLSPTQLELLELAAEEPETWHVDPRAADTFRVMQRFERLVAQVSMPDAPAAASPTPAKPLRTRAATGRPSRAIASSRTSASRSSSVQTRTRDANLKNVVQMWLLAGIVLGVVIYGSVQATQCGGAPFTTGVGGLRCAFAEGLAPLYRLGWWVAGGLFLLAGLMTVVHSRRR